MSISVRNNMSTIDTLNILRKNSGQASKNMAQLASGMRVNGAADDASAYAISEGMRVQLRGLDQDIKNAQNGMSMLRVAEGGVQSTIDILKTLKEKAIDAANDTNTDQDRATIQKEIDQSVDQINDNSNITFNGKYLLDGSYEVSARNVQEVIVDALASEWIENSLEQIEYGYGLSFYDLGDGNGPSVRSMDVIFESDPSSSALAYVTNWSRGGVANKLSLTVNMNYYNNMDRDDVNGKSPTPGASYLDRTIVHEMTHAVMAANIKGFNDLHLYIKEGAAELIHGVDDTRGGELRSYSKSTLIANLNRTDTSSDTWAGTDPYATGYAYLRYLAKHSAGSPIDAMKRFMGALSRSAAGGTAALDTAVAFASKNHFGSHADLVQAMTDDINNASSMAEFYKNQCDIDFGNEDTGSLAGWDAAGTEVLNKEDTVTEGGSTKYWKHPLADSTVINGLTVNWPKGSTGQIGKLQLQIGTKANQTIKLSAFDVRAKALGVQDEEGNAVSVLTRFAAGRAITRFDKALRRALDMQTTIGSLQMRLEYTVANLTTSSENVQGSESTLRDVDMAKAMSEYTKNNVLMQASQSMLQQSYQMSRDVLTSVTGQNTQSVATIEKKSAVEAQHNLQENDSELGKSLEKVSSGMKLNSAGDGASEYAIARRMEVQLRGLDQDIQNVKNGSDLVAIAEGGIQNIVDNLRDMKAMAINAANDSNTDADRATMQKEFEQRLQQIDDIAATTNYNGKLLLNGNWERINHIEASNLSKGADLTNFASRFTAVSSGSAATGSTTKSIRTASGYQSFHCDTTFTGSNVEVKMDFSGITMASGSGPINYPTALHGNGFAILCGGCDQFVDIAFNAAIDSAHSKYNGHVDPINSQAHSYTIGVRDVRNANDLAKAIYDGMTAIVNNPEYTSYAFRINGDTTIVDDHALGVKNNGDGTYSFVKASPPDIYFYEGTIATVVEPLPEHDEPGTPLVIQHGTKANQNLRIYIEDMSTEAMGIKGISIATREKAEGLLTRANKKDGQTPPGSLPEPMGILDKAIEYALDQQTHMGAYRQRLDSIKETLTINTENTLASLSNIRDADLAREMTTFAKYSILRQTSQAMLAQANQKRDLALALLA